MEHPCRSKKRSSLEGADGLIRPQMVVVRYYLLRAVDAPRHHHHCGQHQMGVLNGVAVASETISEVASKSLGCCGRSAEGMRESPGLWSTSAGVSWNPAGDDECREVAGCTCFKVQIVFCVDGWWWQSISGSHRLHCWCQMLSCWSSSIFGRKSRRTWSWTFPGTRLCLRRKLNWTLCVWG